MAGSYFPFANDSAHVDILSATGLAFDGQPFAFIRGAICLISKD